MWSSAPASLPSIDEVEIVDLARLDISATTFVTDARHAPSIRLRGADAQRLAELWRSLPPGEQARCHIPPFGFRFYSAGELLAQASICWACNNIFGEAQGRKLFYEFDASHETSRELLTLAEQTIGHPAFDLNPPA